MKRINDLLISRVQFCLKVCDFFLTIGFVLEVRGIMKVNRYNEIEIGKEN